MKEWNDIDLTSAGFERIGELAEGRVQIHWEYI